MQYDSLRAGASVPRFLQSLCQIRLNRVLHAAQGPAPAGSLPGRAEPLLLFIQPLTHKEPAVRLLFLSAGSAWATRDPRRPGRRAGRQGFVRSASIFRTSLWRTSLPPRCFTVGRRGPRRPSGGSAESTRKGKVSDTELPIEPHKRSFQKYLAARGTDSPPPGLSQPFRSLVQAGFSG